MTSDPAKHAEAVEHEDMAAVWPREKLIDRIDRCRALLSRLNFVTEFQNKMIARNIAAIRSLEELTTPPTP